MGEGGEAMRDFQQIYSDYFSVVYRYIFSLCGDAALAEEVTQEAFFRALKAIDGFRGQCRLDVWLCQIAKNAYFSLCRRQRKRADAPEEIEHRAYQIANPVNG